MEIDLELIEKSAKNNQRWWKLTATIGDVNICKMCTHIILFFWRFTTYFTYFTYFIEIYAIIMPSKHLTRS